MPQTLLRARSTSAPPPEELGAGQDSPGIRLLLGVSPLVPNNVLSLLEGRVAVLAGLDGRGVALDAGESDGRHERRRRSKLTRLATALENVLSLR